MLKFISAREKTFRYQQKFLSSSILKCCKNLIPLTLLIKIPFCRLIFHPAPIHSTSKPTSLMKTTGIKHQISIENCFPLKQRYAYMYLHYAENYKNLLTLPSLGLKMTTPLATIILGCLKTLRGNSGEQQCLSSVQYSYF